MRTLHKEFSGDGQKLLEAPLSHIDHCSRKSHLLDPMILEMTLIFHIDSQAISSHSLVLEVEHNSQLAHDITT